MKNSKVNVPTGKASRLINFGPVCLITSKFGDSSDVTPIAWTVPVSHSPLLIGAAVAKKHFLNELITKSGVFAVNVPGADLLTKVSYCGSISGRTEDKIKLSGLGTGNADKIDCPLIDDCVAHIECRVVNAFDTGDHTFFVGEALHAAADEGFLDADSIPDVNRVATLNHLGGSVFASLKRI